MSKKVIADERWISRKIRDEHFDNVLFDNLVFQSMQFENCSFTRCQFKNSYIGVGVNYKNCHWNHCKFTGKYSAFGRPATFSGCTFNQVFIRSAFMQGVTFSECRFSGRFQSLIFYGTDTIVEPTIFNSVDLSEVELINVDFRCGIDFSSMTLPRFGVRIFHNPDGSFSKQLREVAQTLPKDAQIPISILGSEFYDKQNTIIFETALLSNFLRSNDSRLVFERIASNFEVAA